MAPGDRRPAAVALAAPGPASVVGFVRGPWSVVASLAWVVLAFAAERPLRHALRTAAGLPVQAGPDPLARALESLSVWSLVLAIVVVAVRLTDVPLRDYLAWGRPRRRELLHAVGFVAALYGALLLVAHLGGGAAVHVEHYGRTLAGMTPAAIVLAWWSSVLLAPVVEESVFRGFLWRGIENRQGPAAALLLTTLVFAAFHWGYWMRAGVVDSGSVLQYLVMGGVLGAFRLASGSAVVPMVAHACANAALAAFPAMLAALAS